MKSLNKAENIRKKDVIIALDFASPLECYNFLDKFADKSLYVKVGMELYYKAGQEILREIKKRGHRIFLDLKMHDIPNTVRKTSAILASLDVDMYNVHAGGGLKMMEAAILGAKEAVEQKVAQKMPKIIAVTQLTSTSQEVFNEELGIMGDLQEGILRYAKLAQQAGLAGVVCSPLEAQSIHQKLGEDFLTVTPGIRFASSEKDDQVRITRPGEAKLLGSDYIVVGRPITKATNPVEVYERCLREFGNYPAETVPELESKGSRAEEVARILLDKEVVFLNPQNPFRWASGILSPIYCDNRLLLSYPEERSIIEKYLADLVRTEFPDCEIIMGTATAGIPHAAYVSDQLNLPMGYVRSAAKDHGRQNSIEGKYHKGQKVVVIEDLISTAKSSLECVKALTEQGLIVLGIVSIFTYGMKKAKDALASLAIELRSLSSLDYLVEVALEKNLISPKEKEDILYFRNNPEQVKE